MSATIIQWDPKHDIATRKYREPGIDSPCLMPWRFIFIQEHLKKVYACCYHKRPFGDLETHTLDEIWNNEAIQGMRRELLDGQVPQFCYNNAASCPIIYSLKMNGRPDPIETDIVMGANDYWTLGEGWHAFEEIPDGIRWTKDKAAGRIGVAGRRGLRIEVMTMKPELADKPITGRVKAGETELGTFTIDSPDWKTLIYLLPTLPKGTEPPETVELTIEVDEVWRPCDVFEGNGDTRELGVAVRRIRTF